MALKYLEKAVKLHPRFIRAWGCLGAIYRSLGNNTLSKEPLVMLPRIQPSHEEIFKKLLVVLRYDVAVVITP